MNDSRRILTRRVFLATASVGAAVAALPARPRAVELTPAEEANLKVVNDFCAGWKVPVDWDHLGSFLAANARFRGTQDSPVNEGRDQIINGLRDYAGTATRCEFEVVDSWARGPIVVNDRVDRFTFPDRNDEFKVVGVFHVIDGKIAEWSDFVF